MKNLKQLNSTVVDYLQEYYRQRLRTLQSVDELVEQVAERVDKLGISDNTYIIYTSDNGFHVGQHRMPPGKSTAYEDDINIPMIVRGPGIQVGVTKETISTHTDWAPTLMKLANIKDPIEFDGTPIPLHDDDTSQKYEHVGVEFWGTWDSEGIYGETAKENTYKALRVIGEDYSLSYTVWCTHEHELYDMSADPGQMINLLGGHEKNRTSGVGQSNTNEDDDDVTESDDEDGKKSGDDDVMESARDDWNENKAHKQKDDGDENRKNTSITVAQKKYPVDVVQARLDALVQVLRTCNGTTCIDPWKKLHPDGDVKSLSDALSSRFNDFYENEQVKMKFVECKLGYLTANEGKGAIPFGGKVKRDEIWADTSMKYFDDEDDQDNEDEGFVDAGDIHIREVDEEDWP